MSDATKKSRRRKKVETFPDHSLDVEIRSFSLVVKKPHFREMIEAETDFL